MTDNSRIGEVLSTLDAGLPQALDRLMEFLRIPSVSTDPAYAAEVRRAAEWLCAELVSLGFRAELRDTPGHPMVVAHSPKGTRRPLLFYGHYDVQPVDPLELWERPPFEPHIEDTPQGKVIRGRGASDDKGQLMTFVEAFRAWKAVHGSLPSDLVLLFEGEEESGSPSLRPFLRENAEELRAGIAMICDTGLYADGRPAITTQLRGLCGEEIVIRAADRDLHSGSFGGLAANPVQILVNALATVKDAGGRVALPGFYDGVEELSPELRADWAALGFDPAEFLGRVGLKHPVGETGRTGLEMVWNRPTFEINGITGGYTGEGFKTVLPAEARAKVSFRLTGTQDPDRIRETFRAHVRAHVPEDCTVEFHGHGASPASRMDISDPAFAAAKAALTQEWGREAAYIGAGGSIPIAGDFKEILGMDSMLIGFARDDDRIHSPNEKYDLDSFARGARSWARILAALG
ncbi:MULTISPECIES: dipeptidase [Paracoccus]|uniref:Acetylornithine deacetylase/succinyl-diaminopimelate desuccinylase-like protein n=1 Tax=Paracoccus versutus TaxID=34007 RepID=A0A3D9XSP2_PARVE|nr:MULTISPECIES: dipeptidase [Paracoccus]WGR63051.1 dipeptidase [Paracoccus ferrooxidans]SFX04242.1 Acetylornithine deacetylase/Succinyl-diaminopimelate desuccinylase [Paracoccus pantotrophus]MCJ1899551.1 dipeptidase [Paracoccus versutus]MDF3903653.1 dipeptidase [Paracoccus sp. AS002]REF72721.1 acetylornithine deacetylase/succinyl-diaminopimelate desuccinylase-like protein [Paracoccus versutus]